MLELLPDGTLSPLNQLSDEKTTRHVNRRQILQTIGVVGIGLVLSPKDIFAQSSDVGTWRDVVTHLVETVADCQQAAAINSQLARTTIYSAREATTFHDQYSAPYVFGRPAIASQRVICENGFEVNRLPYYDCQYPCRGGNDLNASEIITVTDPGERKRFGCVLAANGQRTELTRYDHAQYRDLAPHYDLDHTDWKVPYKRPLTGNGKSRIGFQIVHKTQTRRGKPLTEFIVGGDI